MDTGRRQRGGQPKDPAERKRNNLTFRARDQLKASLAQQAKTNSRSLSEEIEHRLEMSFEWERGFRDVDAIVAEASEIAKKSLEEAAIRAGWQRVGSTTGPAWWSGKEFWIPEDQEIPSELAKHPLESLVERAVERALSRTLAP